MSEDMKQGTSELFESEQPEGNPEASNTNDSELVEEATSQSEESKAKEQADKQVAAWQTKIASGNAKFEDAPGWVQERLKGANPQPVDHTDLDAILEEKLEAKLSERLEKEKSEMKFNSLKESLKEKKLTSDQKKALDAEYENLKKYMPKDEALATAIRLSGVGKVDNVKAAKRDAMTIPTPGGTPGNDLSLDDIDEFTSEDDVFAAAEKHRTKSNGFGW